MYKISDESRIIFLPERSSICQNRPEMSGKIARKQSKAVRLLLANPVLYILKTQCTVHFENNHFKINQKPV